MCIRDSIPDDCGAIGDLIPYSRDVIAGSIAGLVEREILTEKTPEEELAAAGAGLSATHGRDPAEMLERYRREVKEGVASGWAAGARYGVQDLGDVYKRQVYKPLYQDADRKYNTSLVRMEAGAHYPSHHHAAIEELFMLSGDLHVENQVMSAGDYCRADSGSIHGETFSDTGCLFLMMASEENQIIENRVI